MSTRSRLAAGLFAAAFFSSTAIIASPRDAAAASPLPTCAYRDVLAPDAGYGQYPYTLLDTTFKLRRTYAPPDLRAAGVAGGGQIRSVAVKDLRAMFAAADKAAAPLAVVSSYRSYARQTSTFAYWVRVEGYQKARLSSARAGHSEHQLGTAIDVTSLHGRDPWLYDDWGKTKAGSWMRTHAWIYGFVLSYPKTSSPSRTCYKYEPWHFRFVGRATAKAIQDSHLSPREWFWRNRKGI